MSGCLHPVHLNRPNSKAGAYRVTGHLYMPYHHYGDFMAKVPVYSPFHGQNRLEMTVSCGKCINCLKKRQNSLAVRCMREAAKRGSMCFLTLTYDDEHLPLSISVESVDKETGECYVNYLSQLVRPIYKEKEGSSDFVAECRGFLDGMETGPRGRVLVRPFYETDEYLYRYLITPSLNRRDVRLWLKKSRMRYKREFGHSLPDFSYVVCGEFGPKTCRPHYHIAFFGLPYKDVAYLRDQWEYGTISNLKQVNAVNRDGTNGFEMASHYIGKYMSKGKFECDCVKDGLAEKPRLMMSKNLGTDLDEALLSYYRCYDLFGKYDIDTIRLESTGVKLTDTQLSSLFQEIRKRSFMVFGDKKYCIPHNILMRIWYVRNPLSKTLRSSKLRLLYTDYFNSNPVSLFIDKLIKSNPSLSEGQIVTEVREFVACSEKSGLLEEEFAENSLISFYSKSIF